VVFGEDGQIQGDGCRIGRQRVEFLSLAPAAKSAQSVW
jgi:hypothetical protein